MITPDEIAWNYWVISYEESSVLNYETILWLRWSFDADMSASGYDY